jgi:hypothetical protein
MPPPSPVPPPLPPPGDFTAFWPIYLRAHSKPLTRRIHVLGTLLAWLLIALSPVFGLLLVPGGLIVGYAFAWGAHGLVEGNRPATFGHPLWSLLADLRMTLLTLAGRLAPELSRHGVGGA